MNSITSSANNIVSPCVTSYDPTAFINVDSSLQETVVVSGIDSEFNIELSPEDSIKLLNGFTVSGFSVDCRLGQKDPEMTGLAVTMDSVDFKAVVENAIGSAVNSASPSETIDKYLANQLRNAFVAAFGSYLPAGTLDGSGNGTDSDNGQDETQADQPTEPAQDARGAAGAVSVSLSTTITGFKVDVLTDAAAAADNLVTQHGLNSSSAPVNIFRQIPKSSWVQYLTDASGWATTYLNTDALPMLKNDVLTFVFDMNVDTAGSNSSAATAEDVPVVNNQSVAYGEQRFSLNLANRRVALNLTLASGSGPFTVGGEEGLRPHPTAWVEGENSGAGNNGADGTGTGSQQTAPPE